MFVTKDTGWRVKLRRQWRDSAALKALTRICPARCFRFDAQDRVALDPASCTLGGHCIAVCRGTGEIIWSRSGPNLT